MSNEVADEIGGAVIVQHALHAAMPRRLAALKLTSGAIGVACTFVASTVHAAQLAGARGDRTTAGRCCGA